MATLHLTDEEKATALWRDLDDAALGRVVKHRMALLQASAQEREILSTTAAALHLVCQAAAARADEATLRLEGVTDSGRPIGSWQVIVRKLG